MMSGFIARRAAVRETVQAQQLTIKISQMKGQAQQLSVGISEMEDQLQQLLTGIARLEDQAQRLSASTVQPESPADGGASSSFAGIGILAVVLLIAGVIVGKLRSKAPGKKKAGTKVAGQAFTSKDRALIELLSEIVDVVNAVEK